jgi:hypothetical protein
MTSESTRILCGLIDKLTQGWNETVEYRDESGNIHTRNMRQRGLISQLRDEVSQPVNILSGGESKPTKAVHAPMPGKWNAFELIEDINAALHKEWEDTALEIAELRKLVRQSRVVLGYDKQKVSLSAKCKVCDYGTLIVDKDAHSDVLCVDCGKRWDRYEWVSLLADLSLLVDTVTAVIYTGRPVGTLHRWASEGRIIRHGGTRPGTARWDLRELPMGVPGQPLPAAPPLPARRPLSTARVRDSTPS